MKWLLLGCAAAFACAPLAAQTYKWVDEKGTVTYGEEPPKGMPATVVDTQPSGPVGTGAPASRPPSPPPPEPRAESAPQPVSPQAAHNDGRGMSFDIYIRLQRGMSEGELLARAGDPDHSSIDRLEGRIVKNYYYYPTPANPFLTTVTLRGGRIAEIERVRRTY